MSFCLGSLPSLYHGLIKKCLLLHAEKLGFEVANLHALSGRFVPDPDPNFFRKSIRAADPVPDSCHLIIWNNRDNSYWRVKYGPKLYKDFHKNPMLEKLKDLFKILYGADGEDFLMNPETG
jgi:hypothetical protein